MTPAGLTESEPLLLYQMRLLDPPLKPSGLHLQKPGEAKPLIKHFGQKILLVLLDLLLYSGQSGERETQDFTVFLSLISREVTVFLSLFLLKQ